jgi:hypothetical protein
LYTDPCGMGPCIIMLKHKVMVWKWALGSRHGLTVHSNFHWYNAIVFVVCSLCLPIPEPHHHHGALCSQRCQTAHPHNAICPVQLKLGFIREEHTSPAW